MKPHETKILLTTAVGLLILTGAATGAPGTSQDCDIILDLNQEANHDLAHASEGDTICLLAGTHAELTDDERRMDIQAFTAENITIQAHPNPNTTDHLNDGDETADEAAKDNLTAPTAAPPGLSDQDPWVDANGDTMFGTLDMGTNNILLRDTPLTSPSPGTLQWAGNDVCVEGTNWCGGSITQINTGNGLTGGPITDTGTIHVATDAITTQMLANGDIELEDLAYTPALQADLTDHIDTLASVNLINDPDNPVDWTRLKNVPDDLADGTDADTTYDGTDFALSDQSCDVGDVVDGVAANGQVACTADQDTTYDAGTGLILDAEIFSVDTSAIQQRVDEACPSGEAIASINQDGTVTCHTTGSEDTLEQLSCASNEITRYDGSTWTCSTDQDTTYTAGHGLTLDGTRFDLQACDTSQILTYDGLTWVCTEDKDTTYDGSDFALSDQGCSSGDVVTGISTDGALTCQTPSDADTLSNLDCAADEITRWDGTNWVCSADEDTDTTYDGTDFALSNQACAEGELVAGVDSTGGVVCVVDQDSDSDTLANLDCANDEIARWDGTTWVCSVDEDTDTTYTAGDALSLSGTSFSLTACPNDKILKHDGTQWICSSDEDTTYAPGDGLELDGTTFDLTQACSSDQILKFDGTSWICGVDEDADTLADLGCTPGGEDIARVLDEDKDGIADGWGCSTDEDTTYDGTDFAESDQGCEEGDVVTGVDDVGNLTCVPDAIDGGDAETVDGVDSSQLLGNETSHTFGGDTLTATGDIEVGGDVRYSSPKQTRTVVQPADFTVTSTEEDDGWRVTGSGYGYITSAPDGIPTVNLQGPVDVPTDAKITQVNCYVYDDDGTEDIDNSSVRLRERSVLDTTFTTLGSRSLDTGSSSTSVRIMGFTISDRVVEDNAAYWLHLRWGTTDTSIDLRFYGCSVFYEHDTIVVG